MIYGKVVKFKCQQLPILNISSVAGDIACTTAIACAAYNGSFEVVYLSRKRNAKTESILTFGSNNTMKLRVHFVNMLPG